MKKYYYASGQRIAMRTGSGSGDTGLLWLLTDHLGSTSVSANPSGSPNTRMGFKPWGELRFGASPTQYQYTGQYREPSLGIDFFNARWYDPALGRFLSADTDVPESQGSGLGFDRYAFVANNPMKYVDMSGHCWGIASFIRGIPGYDTTCNNLDMALSIVQHPKASLKEKALAGGYIALEAGSHAALVVGTASLACVAAGPGCVAAVEGALGIGAGACADGNCTNKIELSARLGQNIWQMNSFDRGWAIENAIGRGPLLQNLPGFPTIDRFVNGIATSIKSIDLGAKTYQNIGTLTTTVQGYINKLAGFPGARYDNVNITNAMIQGRELILAIPPNASAEQMIALQQLVANAANQGVNLVLTVVK
jgi:RHS repeat-associated protein